jgi:hypothetical protein
MITLSPRSLRVKSNLALIPNLSGYYKWWATENTAKKLLGDFYQELLPHLTIGNDELNKYYYMYVGIASKSLRDRLNWHINQKNDLSAVKSGFLSTFRTSISSLISDQSDTKGTNDIIDEMMLQYEVSDNFKKLERSEMIKHILPINIKDQPHEILKNGFRKYLKNARKIEKKHAIIKFMEII